MPLTPKRKLPRLPREWYQGKSVVLWTHTFEDRATGWLDVRFHCEFRMLMLHACARYALACPTYVLMPDHWHVVWMGLNSTSDQWMGTSFLREFSMPHLGPAKLQDRAHDHVLREEERKRGAFESACHYVRENPVRAGLIQDWQDWPYLGGMVAGYPDLDINADDYWDRFWRIYNRNHERPNIA
jgi:putative transposase